ncbi:MAG: glycosyltransferase family 2 protein [Sphingobium sp.]
MSETEILLSICVPTFNRQFLLERNVTFHLREFRRLGISFELVLVDDCSTDETPAYLASLSDEPEVSIYRRVRNSGFLSNYAFAMQRARGRYAVFLGDDDLLIPEKVVEYLAIMENDADIGMVQAPWLLVDARPGGGDMSPFYQLPGPSRQKKGDFRAFLEFILNHHVFPEFLIVRRDILAQSISSATPFIFWAFLFTARALDKTDILFVPEPFARVTAISDDPRIQQGNNECMFQWDSYRGGLEFIGSHMFKGEQPGEEDRRKLTNAIMRFMAIRQSVALRLLIQSRHWVEAYVLYHRMAAYRPVELQGISIEIIASLAGTTVAATEAGQFGKGPAIVDPAVDNDLLDLLAPKLLDNLTRDLPAADDPEPRAWLRIDPAFGEPVRDGDAVFELPAYLKQFF